VAVNFIGRGNRSTRGKPPTYHKSLTNFSHNVVHLPWLRFELTTSVVIDTDCIGSCKSNYHTITVTTAPQSKWICGLWKNDSFVSFNWKITYKYHFGINDHSSKEINMSRGGHVEWRLEAMQVIFWGTNNKLWYIRYRVRSSCPLISDDSFIYHTINQQV
jgi:hypothetical protein